MAKKEKIKRNYLILSQKNRLKFSFCIVCGNYMPGEYELNVLTNKRFFYCFSCLKKIV